MSRKPLVTLAEKLQQLDLDADEVALLDHILSRAEADAVEVEGFSFLAASPTLGAVVAPIRLQRAGGIGKTFDSEPLHCGIPDHCC